MDYKKKYLKYKKKYLEAKLIGNIKQEGGTAPTELPEPEQVFNYPGKLLNPQMDELNYMTESLSLKIEEKVEEDDRWYRGPSVRAIWTIDNIVIQALEYDEYALETCELTRLAYKEGVGVKYLTHVIVKSNNIPKRVYLFTKYVPQISPDFDETPIRDFAEKISDTKLVFHPDFWYKNICVTDSRERELKAIGWHAEMYTNIENIIKSTSSEEMKEKCVTRMMKRYDKMKKLYGDDIIIN